jgi:prepilin-type N-terminal cleavage/methylation domain-containing protein
MRTHSCRTGLTLVELIVVVVIIGLMSLIGLRQLTLFLDRIATRDAVRAAGHVVERARDEAVALHTPVSVKIDTSAATLELLSRGLALGKTDLGELHGVALSTTRDSITFDVRGLGYGAANLTLIARRGRSIDSLIVSRLGRVRY